MLKLCELIALKIDPGDGKRCSLLIERVVDVCRAETDGRPPRAAMLPVVVGICDAKMALVLVGVAVAVSDQGGLPVIMEVSASMVS